jgi:lipopolysaccharide transport system ATP-binding protein
MISATDTVIRCTNLGKCYQIYDNPKARLKQAIWRGRRQYFKEFWALRHVNFELNRGESLGIIGHNGSGKSTLLQLICGTLTPSEGKVESKGRIAALLELGSGFNPEFTGIENIYLNASMLGLSKENTDSRLDDILAFADIGEFAYQPVKKYSSGMALRLAFAVMAHIDADILIVDEALSVGDAFFTQKCMRFINRFRQDNCLLFVSHEASAITSLCERAILLKCGHMEACDVAKKVMNLYTQEIYSSLQDVSSLGEIISKQPVNEQQSSESHSAKTEDWVDYRADLINSSQSPNLFQITQFNKNLEVAESFGDGRAIIRNVTLIDRNNRKLIHSGLGGERVTLKIEALALSRMQNPIIGFLLKNDKGLTLLGDNTLNQRTELHQHIKNLEQGDSYYAEFEFTLPLLPMGKYSFTTSLAEGNQNDHRQLQWLNDALLLESINCCVAAGLAGVPMHRITLGYAEVDREQ